MAALNPDVQQTKDPNFISNSSEQPKSAQYNAAADVSTADIVMNNLTNVIPALAEGGDRLTKLAIDNSIYDQNDKLNREFGATDMIALNDAKVPAIPSSLEDSAKNLQRVNQAYQTGAISKTTFDIKVASMASDLRAQYGSPYLRDYIDKKVQDVTGVDPQNQVRRDIFSAVEKNKDSALEENKKKISLATDLAKDGVSVPGWENMSLTELINNTAVSQKYLDQHKRFQAASDDDKTKQTLADEDHIRAAQGGLTGLVVQNFSNIHSNLGKTKAEIDSMIGQMTTMTGEKKALLVAKTNQWADQVMATARAWVVKNYTAGNLTKEKSDQILQPTQMLLDNYRQAVVSGNSEYLKDITDRLQAMKTNDDIKFMDVPGVRAAGSANRVLGNLAGAAAMESWLPQITKAADRIFARDELYQVYGTNNGISLSDSYQHMKDKGVKDQKAFTSLTGTSGAMLDNPQATPEEVEKSVRFLYGADNYQFIARLPDNQKAQAYATLYSPQRTKSMERIRDSGDINSWNAYVTSSKRMFGPTFRQSAMSMQQNSIDPNSYRVSYNADTHQFQFDPTLDKFNPRGNPVAVPSHPEIEQINQGLKAIAPVLKANGQSVEEYLQRQFEESGMTGPPGGWRQSDNAWNQIGGAFFDTAAAVKMQSGASKLGGPDTGGQGQSPEGNPNDRQVSGEDEASRRAQLKDLTDAFNKTEDPEVRAMLKQEMKSLQKGPEPSPTFGGPNPRGAPNAGTPTDEQQMQGRDAIDMLTGIPSFMEAVQKGDAAGAALAAATILPFPAGKAAKAGEKLAEGGAKIIDNVTREARGVEKGMAAQSAREASVVKELQSIDVSKLSDEGLQAVEDQLRTSLSIKSLSGDQLNVIFNKIKEISNETYRRSPLSAEDEMFRLNAQKTADAMDAEAKLKKNKGLRIIEGDKE